MLSRVPFGQTPSLHPLRDRLSGVVRRLRRYCGPVRLPVPVHRRRTSLDFPTRPATSSAAGGHGISRFSCEVCPYVLGVSDRAGSRRVSRYRRAGWSLPLLLTASAPRREVLSRLNTRPARAPVNASTPPLQAAPHDSGSVWVATPSPYDSFIHNTSPVYPGAQGDRHAHTFTHPAPPHLYGYPDLHPLGLSAADPRHRTGSRPPWATMSSRRSITWRPPSSRMPR